MLNHKGSSVLETKRLVLRKFTLEDADDMYNNWANDDEVTVNLTWPTHTDKTVSKNVISSWLEEYSNNEFYQWAIVIKESGNVIGSISLMDINNSLEMCEVGYCIGRLFWNKGLVTEAFSRIIKFALLDVDFNRITGRHRVGNPASGRVMENAT